MKFFFIFVVIFVVVVLVVVDVVNCKIGLYYCGYVFFCRGIVFFIFLRYLDFLGLMLIFFYLGNYYN